MTEILVVLLALMAAVLVLMLVEPVTRRCRRRLHEYESVRAATEAPPGEAPSQESPEPRTTTAPPPVPEAETLWFHVRRLLSTEAVLGAFFLLLLAVFFPMNSRILAENFEILFNRIGRPLAIIGAAGWQWTVTDLQLYGLALSVALILLGAAYSFFAAARSGLRWLVLFGALGPIVVFEVGLAIVRGFLVATEAGASPILLAIAGGLQAWVCVLTEFIGGHVGIPQTLVPWIQALGWALVAPFRFVVRTLMRLRSVLPVMVKVKPDPRRPGLFVRLLAYIDESIMNPLRTIDDAVMNTLRSKLRAEKERPNA